MFLLCRDRAGRLPLSFFGPPRPISLYRQENPSLASSKSLLLLSGGGEEGLILRGVVRCLWMDSNSWT